MAKLNKNAKAWSVAAGKILEKIKPGMPDAMVEQIREQANDQALKGVYGADYMLNLDGQPTGSRHWLNARGITRRSRDSTAPERPKPRGSGLRGSGPALCSSTLRSHCRQGHQVVTEAATKPAPYAHEFQGFLNETEPWRSAKSGTEVGDWVIGSFDILERTLQSIANKHDET
jgi:hypothetical protein